MNVLFVSVVVLLGLSCVSAGTETCQGAGRGDPLFIGFHGQHYHFSGRTGHTYNIYNDLYVAVLSEFAPAVVDAVNHRIHGTVMSKMSVLLPNFNITVGVTDYRNESSSILMTINNEFHLLDATITQMELSDCLFVEWDAKEAAVSIYTGLHQIKFTVRTENQPHLATTYFDFSINHPAESVDTIGGVLGQTAHALHGISLAEADFETVSLLNAACPNNFYDAVEYKCAEAEAFRSAGIVHSIRTTLDNSNSDFESPVTTDRDLRPTGASWTFEGEAYVAKEGQTYDWPGSHPGQFAALDSTTTFAKISRSFLLPAGGIFVVDFDYSMVGTGTAIYQVEVRSQTPASSQRVYDASWTVEAGASKVGRFVFRCECAGTYTLKFHVPAESEVVLIDNVIIRDAVAADYATVTAVSGNRLASSNNGFDTPDVSGESTKFKALNFEAAPWIMSSYSTGKVGVARSKTGTGSYKWNTADSSNQAAVLSNIGSRILMPVYFTTDETTYTLSWTEWGRATSGALKYSVSTHSTFSDAAGVHVIGYAAFTTTQNAAAVTRSVTISVVTSGFYYIDIAALDGLSQTAILDNFQLNVVA